MDKIEVGILHESHACPAGMMMFLAKLTQRGHNVKTMDDLHKLYSSSIMRHNTAADVVQLPHGTIKRFTPITVAIVGASRRFLAQARTHQVGMTYVSASLQYSDYSNKAGFVVPFEVLTRGIFSIQEYKDKCARDLKFYEDMIEDGFSNDTAGYAMNQALRNILIITANHEAWSHFIRVRGCNRNTVETQYVALRIWEQLLKTNDGQEMFAYAGPDCLYGSCREGNMSCRNTILAKHRHNPTTLIEERWPIL